MLLETGSEEECETVTDAYADVRYADSASCRDVIENEGFSTVFFQWQLCARALSVPRHERIGQQPKLHPASRAS